MRRRGGFGPFGVGELGWPDLERPASTVSLSLRVIRYQLRSSLLKTATISRKYAMKFGKWALLLDKMLRNMKSIIAYRVDGLKSQPELVGMDNDVYQMVIKRGM